MKWFRPLLERDGFVLTDYSHMRGYIPMIEAKGFELVKTEVAGRFMSISFDGTSRLGEAISVTGRFISDDFNSCVSIYVLGCCGFSL